MIKQLKGGKEIALWGLQGLLVLLAITGCGGSGSSGFDEKAFPGQPRVIIVTPGDVVIGRGPAITTEDDAIIQAVEARDCEEMKGVLFCAIDAEHYNRDRHRLHIETIPSLEDPVSCILDAAPNRGCASKISVLLKETDPSWSHQFFVAVRYHYPFSSSWKIVAGFTQTPSNSKQFESVVPFKLSSEKGATVDFAVLAYLDAPSSQLPEIGTTQYVLSDLKPSVVFVAPRVSVEAHTLQ